jgi:hypothetical protein
MADKKQSDSSPGRARQVLIRAQSSAADFSKVRKNAKGGILISPEEIQAAFEFLDADKEGRVSMSSLKKRLQVFFPNMTTKEYRYQCHVAGAYSLMLISDF